MDKWISIQEQEPPKNTKILAKSGKIKGIIFVDKNGFFECSECISLWGRVITYWKHINDQSK